MAQTHIEKPEHQESSELALRRFAFLVIIALTAIIVSAGLLLPADAPPAEPSNANTQEQQQAGAADVRGEAPPELVKEINDLKARLEANPKDVTALISLGDIFAAVANSNPDYFKQAEELYGRAIQAEPKYPVAYARLGDLYYNGRRWGPAASNYLSALEIVPKDADIRSRLAVCYNNQENYALAAQEFKKVTEQQPNNMLAHYALGNIYIRTSPPDINAAIVEWETVIKLEPASQQAKDALKLIEQYKKK